MPGGAGGDAAARPRRRGGDAAERKDIYRRLAGEVVETVKTERRDGRAAERRRRETRGGILHWGREGGPDLDWLRDRVRAAHGGRAPKVLDPFAGGGALPLEAMWLGCAATAIDLNPVAWFILKCTLDYPRRLVGETLPLPEFVRTDRDFTEAFLKARGFRGKALPRQLAALGLDADGGDREWALIDDARRWDDPLLQGDLAWQVRAWGRLVLARVRAALAHRYPTWATFQALAPGGGPFEERPLALLEPEDAGEVDAGPLNAAFDATYLKDPRNPRWVAKPTVAYLWARTVRCKSCRATLPLLKTRWLCRKDRKRVLLTVTTNADGTGVAFGVEAEVPPARGNAALGFRIPLYGLDRWAKLFTDRQLLALGSVLREIRRCNGEVDGMEDLPARWREAITACLVPSLGRLADRGSALATWTNDSGEYPQHVRPFRTPRRVGLGPGGLLPCLAAACAARRRTGRGPGVRRPPRPEVERGERRWRADRRCQPVRRRQGTVEADLYEDGMARAFRACHEALNPAGRLVVMFANKSPDAWETLVAALIRAGFVVTGSWPIRTEMQNRQRSLASAALASSVWLVCRKRPPAGPGWDAAVLAEMRGNITRRLRSFWDAGIRGPDFVWAAGQVARPRGTGWTAGAAHRPGAPPDAPLARRRRNQGERLHRRPRPRMPRPVQPAVASTDRAGAGRLGGTRDPRIAVQPHRRPRRPRRAAPDRHAAGDITVITSLRLEDFKNFADETLPVGPFTVIVGANASGKSNLRDAFRFLHGIGRGYTLSEIIGGKYGVGGQVEWEPIRGAANELVRFGRKTLSIGITAKLASAPPYSSLVPFYRIGARLDEEGGFRVESEELGEESGEVTGTGYPYIRYIYTTHPQPPDPVREQDDDAHLLLRMEKTGNQRKYGHRIEVRWDQPALTQLQGVRHVVRAHKDRAREVADLLGHCRFLDPTPDLMRKPAFPGQLALGDSGENLPTVLQKICTDEGKKEALFDWTRELTPMDVADFEFPRDPTTGLVQLAIREKSGRRISAYSASDGTLRFLAMLAALLDEEPAGLYFFEEIDNGIHPSRLHLLVDLIERQTRKSTVQVVTTTHSPELLSMVNDDTLRHMSVVCRSEDTEDAVIRPVAGLPNAEELRKTQGLGRLLAGGWMETALAFTEGDGDDEGDPE